MMHLRKTPVLLLLLVGATPLSAQSNDSNKTYQPDTLRRELVLEKEYVPGAMEAKKEFFNPLAGGKGNPKLKPLHFAQNSYGVTLSTTPRVIEPLYNSFAQNPDPRNWHIRLYGGYPMRLGANLGMHFNAGENGSLEIGIDHDSRKSDIKGLGLPFYPNNETHDTEVSFRYGQKLSSRMLSLSATAYHNLESLYGLPINYTVEPELPGGKTPAYNLYRRIGGEIGFELSPAPLLKRSPWQYSLYTRVGYGKMEIPSDVLAIPRELYVSRKGTPVRLSDAVGDSRQVAHMSGYDIEAGGSLAYGLKVYNFNFGADVDFRLSGMNASDASTVKGDYWSDIYGRPMVLSGTPYLSYLNDDFSAKAGVRIQLLGGVKKKVLFTPAVDLRWKAHPFFSLLLSADGGGELTGFRHLYDINRYALSPIGAPAMDVARYRVSGGFEVGNLYGFSATLRGGYGEYIDLYDWSAVLSGYATTKVGLPAIIYTTLQNEDISIVFVEGTTGYVSPIGLSVSCGLRYDKYTSQKDPDKIISGRPSITLHAAADYRINDAWSVGAQLEGLGGIKQGCQIYEILNTDRKGHEPGNHNNGSRFDVVESVPFVLDLTARVSYDFSKYAGLSIIGTNLLNQHHSVWLGYGRPGAGIMAALTLHF